MRSVLPCKADRSIGSDKPQKQLEAPDGFSEIRFPRHFYHADIDNSIAHILTLLLEPCMFMHGTVHQPCVCGSALGLGNAELHFPMVHAPAYLLAATYYSYMAATNHACIYSGVLGSMALHTASNKS
jgi:hypothetical protein